MRGRRSAPSPRRPRSRSTRCSTAKAARSPSIEQDQKTFQWSVFPARETSGALIREYVWNGCFPVAVIEGGVISYVRADHIGRPVFATNASGVKVWTATSALASVLGRSGGKQSTGLFSHPPHPFGGVHTSTGAPPSARFPGQWFQSESGLHQNWMRDDDPTTGRYLQADPLGLVDGASVYGYVKGNPSNRIDPLGLFEVTVPDVVGWPVRDLDGPMMGGGAGGSGSLVNMAAAAAAAAIAASRADQDPISLAPVDVGRDCDGNCNPCPPNVKWYVPGAGHGHENGVWHEIRWNQNPLTCTCYPDRPSQG